MSSNSFTCCVSLFCIIRSSFSHPLAPPSGAGILLDHLVGAGEHAGRHLDAQRLRGLEIDHQLVLRWGLHRKVGRLLALENAVDVARGVPVLVEKVGSIGDQAAGVDPEACDYTAGSLWRAARATITSRKC